MNNLSSTFLYDKLSKQYNEEMLKKIIEGYSQKRRTTFRVNTLKSTREEVENVLNENNITYENVQWYKDAFILKNATEIELRNLNIYEDGKIYIQSLSSMIPPLFIKPQSNENILDMAAAPGSKTTQIAALSNNTALITACEKNKIRAEKLRFNLEKQGVAKVTVLEEDARHLNEYFSFDKILLDTPCSGSGTINLEQDYEKHFTEDLLNKIVKVQHGLLDKAISLLKPGSEMIYSTCSILKEENEENIERLISSKKVEVIPIDDELLNNIPSLPTSICGAITVCPTELYEGFFVAKLKKIK